MIKQFKTEIFSNNPTKNNCVFAACIQSQQDDLETPLTGQNMEISFIVFYVFRLLDRRTKSGIFFTVSWQITFSDKLSRLSRPSFFLEPNHGRCPHQVQGVQKFQNHLMKYVNIYQDDETAGENIYIENNMISLHFLKLNYNKFSMEQLSLLVESYILCIHYPER